MATLPVRTSDQRRRAAAKMITAQTSMIAIAIESTYPWMYTDGVGESVSGQKLSRILAYLAVSVVTDRNVSGANVTQATFARPLLINIVVPTANATDARSWFATPKSGRLWRCCPSR
jgi:hypothetical protein